MDIRLNQNYDEMSRATADFISDYIRTNPSALLCLTSGHTPTGTFKYLAEDVVKGKLDVTQCSFVGLDEWGEFNQNNPGSCRHYMDHHLFFPLNIQPHQIEFFDGAADSPEKECRRTNEFISRRGSINLILLGLGLNGHLGMNEPGVDFNLDAHVAKLAEQTKKTAQKYFDYEVKLDFGLTLGSRHIQESGIAILIASGSNKAAILAETLEGKISNNVPASILQKHANAYCFADRDAAALLSS